MRNFFKALPIKGWSGYFDKKERTLLWIILLAGIVVRIYQAAAIQFWIDEIYIFFVTRSNSFLSLFFQNHWDASHPAFYYLFLHFWQKISITPFFLRIPSLIASGFVLYLTPILARTLLPKNKPFPIALLLIFALSMTQIGLGIEAEPYAFEILFMIVSLITFFKLLNGEKDRFIWIVFGVSNFLMLINDYGGVWLLGTYALFLLIFYIIPRKKKGLITVFLKSLIVTLLLYLPWLPVFMVNLTKGMTLESRSVDFGTGNPISANLFQTNFFVGSWPGGLITRWGISLYTWNALLFALALMGIYLLWRKKKNYAYFLLLGIFIPAIVSFTFSIYVSPIFVSRNLLLINILILIGYAVVLSRLFYKSKFLFFISVALILASFAPTLLSPRFYYNNEPVDWEGTVKYLKNSNYPDSSYVALPLNDPVLTEPLEYYALVDDVNLKVLSFREIEYYGNSFFKKHKLYFLDADSLRLEGGKVNWGGLEYALGCILEKVDFKGLFFGQCKF